MGSEQMLAWFLSRCELLDARQHYAPDLDGLAIAGDDVLIVWIGSLEPDVLALLPQLRAGVGAIDHRHHDLPMAWPDCPVHQNDIAMKNAFAAHRVSAHPQGVGRRGVQDDAQQYINVLCLEIIGWRGKPGIHAGVDPPGRQAGDIALGRGAKGIKHCRHANQTIKVSSRESSEIL